MQEYQLQTNSLIRIEFLIDKHGSSKQGSLVASVKITVRQLRKLTRQTVQHKQQVAETVMDRQLPHALNMPNVVYESCWKTAQMTMTVLEAEARAGVGIAAMKFRAPNRVPGSYPR